MYNLSSDNIKTSLSIMANSSKPALEGSTQYKNRHGFQMLFFFPCDTRWVLIRYPPSIMEEMTMGFLRKEKKQGSGCVHGHCIF
jgi:hypothetical protein